MARLYGESLGEEARYRGKDMILGPGVNIYRTPLAGRNFEYMGEDPLLASRMVVPYVQGLQSKGVASCVKHYALNNDEEYRHQVNVVVSDRALHEIYLPAFRAAITEGKAWGIMGAYNLYNDQHNCHNEITLNRILKGDWGFDGVVVSDWGGCHDTEQAIFNGLDMEFGTWTDGLTMGRTNAYDNYYLAEPFKKLINEATGQRKADLLKALDEKVRRVLRLYFRTTMNKHRAQGFLCYEHGVNLKAGQNYVFWVSDVHGKDLNPVKLVFDFGHATGATNVNISNIVLKDHANDDGTIVPGGGETDVKWVDVNSADNLGRDFNTIGTMEFWWADGGWQQIGNPKFGQSAMKNKSDYLGAERWNIINLEKPYMSYTNANVIYEVDDDGKLIGTPYAEYNGWGGPNVEHRVSSLFGRVSYNYDEKYMLQATIRRDGSSRFGPENKYGTFPSVSVGWNIMNEKFMEQTQSWLSNLKFRASWGKNGSDDIDNFLYTVENVMGNNVLFGNPAIKQIGSKASTTANPSIKWEESEQTDLGLDLGFFNQALTFTVDYYIKKTNGMLMTMPIPSYVGENKPVGNVGDMENKGVEFELGYKWHISDAHFSVKANATYTKTTLKNLGNESGFIEYDGVQGFTGGPLARGSNGMPFPYFYGYKTAGVFQNYGEVNAYTNANGGLIQPSARPGDTPVPV